MILVVDPHSGIPVYRQLIEQIRLHVTSGLLELLQEDQATILVCSHVLRDVEKIFVWVATAITTTGSSIGPATEITAAALLFMLSQLIYRRNLRNYFSTADLI